VTRDEARQVAGAEGAVRRWPRVLLSAALLGAAAAALLVVPVVALATWDSTAPEPDDSGQGSVATAPGGPGAHHDGSHHVVAGGGEPDAGQLATIREATARYADIDVARAEGWVQEHADTPEVGAHFARTDGRDEPADGRPALDLAHPSYLMYSRLGRSDWELVAVAYVVDQALSPRPPTELRGAAYHEHVWTCVVDGEELDEDDVGPISRADCGDRGGEWSPGGVWMTHVWFVDNPDGVFAETNPALV
jgi:hypothetical protein